MRVRFRVPEGQAPPVDVLVRGPDAGVWAKALARLHGTGEVWDARSHRPHRPSLDGSEVDLCVDVADGLMWSVPGGAPASFDDRASFVSALEARISEMILARSTGYVFLHAAGLAGPWGATLVLGASGAGKSSLALAWAADGGAIFGDDVVLLDGSGLVHAHPRPIKVARAQVEAAELDPTTTLEFDSEWSELWVEPGHLAGWADPQPVALVVLARWDPDAPPGGEMIPLKNSEALQRMVRSVLHPADQDPAGTLERCIQVIEEASAVTLWFNTTADALRHLRAIASAAQSVTSS